MNNIFRVTFFVMITLIARGQDTKKIKQETDGELQQYYVLKSDKNVEHGPYEKYFRYSNPMSKGKLLTERGQYDNNEKTGTWTFYWGENNIISKGSFEKGLRNGTWEYYKNGIVNERGDYKNDLRDGMWTYVEKDKGILESGYYKDGKKIGKWTYQYYDVIVQAFDYSQDSVLQSYNDSAEWEAIIEPSNEIVKVVLSRAPQYIGYKRQLQADMSSLTEYPIEARRKGLEGKVVVGFLINEDGSTSDFKIIKDIGGNCGQAIIDAYKSNKVKWVSGIYNGKKVKVKYYQTVSFELKDDPISGLGESVAVYE